MKKLFSFIAIACIAMTVSAEQITVAQALQIAGQLEKGATTAEEYEVVGYVTAYAGADAATDGGWSKYSNQIFWIADKKNIKFVCLLGIACLGIVDSSVYICV